MNDYEIAALIMITNMLLAFVLGRITAPDKQSTDNE